MFEIPQIHTPHLFLRPFSLDDSTTLQRIYQDESVLRYFPDPSPPPLDKVERFLIHQQNHWEQYGYGNWAITPESDNVIVGWAGLQYLPELNETEVGYLLEPSFWGKGFATEAALASLRYGFDHFDFMYIIALIHPENIASRRVIEKCGAVYTETLFLWGIQLMRFVVKRDFWLIGSYRDG
jgi:ribosomal-protein-alanine N-acetyltransferase